MSADTCDDNGRRRFVPADDVVAQFKGAPHVEAERFRADLDRVEPDESLDETTEE